MTRDPHRHHQATHHSITGASPASSLADPGADIPPGYSCGLRVLLLPLGFRLHVLAAWALFAFWPFSRLVHPAAGWERVP
jgi:hypothetical protein